MQVRCLQNSNLRNLIGRRKEKKMKMRMRTRRKIRRRRRGTDQ